MTFRDPRTTNRIKMWIFRQNGVIFQETNRFKRAQRLKPNELESSMHHLTDEALVALYIEQGDNRAFQKLVMRHKDRIFGYLLGMVRDRDLANDLFQDTFVRVIKAMNNERGTYSSQGKWLQWAMRIARNAALDHLRSKKRWKMSSASTDEEHDLTLNRLEDYSIQADDLIHFEDRKEWLYACIDKLPK